MNFDRVYFAILLNTKPGLLLALANTIAAGGGQGILAKLLADLNGQAIYPMAVAVARRLRSTTPIYDFRRVYVEVLLNIRPRVLLLLADTIAAGGDKGRIDRLFNHHLKDEPPVVHLIAGKTVKYLRAVTPQTPHANLKH